MIEKHNKIKGFLARRYINEHKGDQEESSRKIIKQEIKRKVKTEVKKEESSQTTA